MRKLARLKLDSSQKVRGDIRGLGIFEEEGTVYLYYTISNKKKHTLHVATSQDGFIFEKKKEDVTILTSKNQIELVQNIFRLHIWPHEKEYLLTYIKEALGEETEKAWSKDLHEFTVEGLMLGATGSGIIIPEYRHEKNHVMLTGGEGIHMFVSKDLISWNKAPHPVIKGEHEFNSRILDIAAAHITPKGILVIYFSRSDEQVFAGVILLDRQDPTRVLWAGNKPLWSAPVEWHNKKVTPFGAAFLGRDIIGYFDIQGEGLHAAILGLYKEGDGHTSKSVSLTLDRAHSNPVISPSSKNHWEAFNTFNPAALYDEGKVHLLYRAQGFDYVSVLGYAASDDGLNFHTRHDIPAYTPTQPFEDPAYIHSGVVAGFYVSGGGFGGCEDPRMTKIDDKVYLTYVAFDGISPPRVALTSIDSRDFLSQRWLWERPVLISPPGVVDKSAVIFPRKVKGKYVIMHRIYPHILIDFVDHLSFDGSYWLKGEHKISPRPDMWDSRKIGAGAPPIETPEGWLLIYQSVGEQDSGRYKIGAMLLDLEDPTKVLHRSNAPILEPDAHYENEGFKAGVIYPCGAVVIDGTLYVYYGGADSYVCVATAKLDNFLAELMHSEVATLTTPIVERII